MSFLNLSGTGPDQDKIIDLVVSSVYSAFSLAGLRGGQSGATGAGESIYQVATADGEAMLLEFREEVSLSAHSTSPFTSPGPLGKTNMNNSDLGQHVMQLIGQDQSSPLAVKSTWASLTSEQKKTVVLGYGMAASLVAAGIAAGYYGGKSLGSNKKTYGGVMAAVGIGMNIFGRTDAWKKLAGSHFEVVPGGQTKLVEGPLAGAPSVVIGVGSVVVGTVGIGLLLSPKRKKAGRTPIRRRHK